MSGENESLFDLPPGLNRTVSQYAAGKTWWNGNLIRWVNKMLTPVGGWVKQYDIPFTPAVPDETIEPYRSTHSWRDLLKKPWAVYGSANRLTATEVNNDGTYTFYDITPSDLGYNPGGSTGYGSGSFGSGPYGISGGGGDIDANSLWSLDNFGKMLVGVASQDGRLVIWDPSDPSTKAAPIPEAPVDNTLVLVTDEEFLMVLGGKNNPRRIKWASQRTSTDWTPTETNSAGGFDLQSNGVIVAACTVPGGILVLTDTDAHVIEYVGAPYYYGRRRVSDECEIVSANALVPLSFGAVWMGNSCFWMYNGAVSRMPSSVELDVFYGSEHGQPHLVHGGVNQHAQEAWWFYPSNGSTVPNKAVIFGYNQAVNSYWSLGTLTRTAWLNPVWQDKPIGINSFEMYIHETGNTANGLPLNAFAETGAMEISEGTVNTRVDRLYPDVINHRFIEQPVTNLEFTFKMRQAPTAEMREYGPVSINTVKGYIPLRMRARQISVKVRETAPGYWGLGKLRIRIKSAGHR